MDAQASLIRNRLLIPALGYLIITLLTGLLLRFMWYHPVNWGLHPPFLIHAHSHIALLGWLLPSLIGFIIALYLPAKDWKASIPLWLILPLHALLLIMTWAFATQGYAAISITVSTLLVVLTCWISLTLLHELKDSTAPGVPFIKAALWLQIISNIGPLALGAGTFMGTGWIQFWVAFYLHLQFNGWILLGIIGLILGKLSCNMKSSTENMLVWVFVAGISGTFEASIRTAATTLPVQFIGFAGGIILLVAIIIVVNQWFRKNKASQVRDFTQALFISGSIFLLGKAIMHVAGGLPAVGIMFTGSKLLAIAYAHWSLLGMATTLILWMYLSGRSANLPIKAGIALYIFGTVTMMALLVYFGIIQLLYILPAFSMQASLFFSGFAAFTGFLLLTKFAASSPLQ